MNSFHSGLGPVGDLTLGFIKCGEFLHYLNHCTRGLLKK